MKKETLIHRLDPRTKLLFSIIYTIGAIMFTDLIPLLIIFLTLIPILILGRMVKEWLRSVRGLSFIFLIIIVINTFFLSLSYAISMIFRIMIMISAFSIFFLTVHPNDLALSFISMKIPYEIAFSFSLAFRFVPTIANEAQNIIDAQQSRGYEMQEKGLVNKVKNLFPLLIPLIICSIRRAFNVAEALESRAFGSKKERTFYYSISFSKKDWIFTLYLFIFIIIWIVIRIQFASMPEWFLWSLPVWFRKSLQFLT